MENILFKIICKNRVYLLYRGSYPVLWKTVGCIIMWNCLKWVEKWNQVTEQARINVVANSIMNTVEVPGILVTYPYVTSWGLLPCPLFPLKLANLLFTHLYTLTMSSCLTGCHSPVSAVCENPASLISLFSFPPSLEQSGQSLEPQGCSKFAK